MKYALYNINLNNKLIKGIVSETYCAGYSQEQQNVETCGEGGLLYWCANKEKCGVVSFFLLTFLFAMSLKFFVYL